MSEYHFGCHDGHLCSEADEIAARYGATHTNHTDPNGRKTGWFSCPNRGHPHNQRIARLVLDDIFDVRVGGFYALRTSNS